MKKILFASTAAIMLALMVSCGGSKSTDAATEEGTATEQVTEEAPEVTTDASSSDVLKKYEEFVDKVIPLLAKMKTGDIAAVQEYTKLAEELTKFTQDNAAAFGALTEADAKKYEEIAKKLVDAAQ